MFDSHCHLNFKAFASDAPTVANAMANDQVGALVVGCDLLTSRYGVELAQTFPNLWAAVGVHPIHVIDRPWDPIIMKELALENRVVAIGEVGLDFYRLPDNPIARQAHIKAQYQTLAAALTLATQVNKPLVLHSRQAYDQLLKILTDYFGTGKSSRPRGTIHCFMGNWTQARQFLDLGFLIGFTGVITYNDVDRQLIEVVKRVPLDKILIETDAPYLTPEPYRGQAKKNKLKTPRNLPQYVLEVAKKIAERRALPTMEIVDITDRNARHLFEVPSDSSGNLRHKPALVQHSAGGVVYRQINRQIDICFIKDSYGSWTFPKGHLETNESAIAAATREIAEEIGIPSQLLELRADLGQISYSFISDFASDKAGQLTQGPVNIHKFVHYYLFEVPYDTKLSHQIEEIAAVAWVSLAQIDTQNSYKHNLPIINKAKDFFKL